MQDSAEYDIDNPLKQIHNMKLMIVDDEPFNVSLLERIVKKAGFNHYTSLTDSQLFKDVFRKYAPDLLLLDMRMPNLDGFEILDWLREEGFIQKTPVIVLTAETSRDSKLRALQAGAKDYITKPVDRTEVLTRIFNLLETQRLYKSLFSQNLNLDKLVQARTAELHIEQQRLERLNNTLEEKVSQRTTDLQKLNTDLENINHSMSELVSIVSHELRTPLTSIKSFAEILRDDGDSLDKASRDHFLSIIDEESDRLSRLISDLLDLQKISSGKMVWRTRTIDLAEMFRKTVEFFTPAYQDKGLTLTLQYDVAPALVVIDDDKFRQVATNLLSNALKFTDQGQVSVSIRRVESWARILLLSQDQETVSQLKHATQHLGIEILQVTEAEQVFAELNNGLHRVDMTIIDVASFDDGSLQHLSRLRKEFPQMPVTSMFAHTGRHEDESQFATGSAFVHKPIDPERDAAHIERIITDLIGINPQLTMLEVAVQDQGIGIPPTDINKVFTRFHQVDSSQIREQRGTGLGLTICKEIIEHYHGKIWVESSLGHGSTFSVLLPELSGQRQLLGEALVETGLLTEEQLDTTLGGNH